MIYEYALRCLETDYLQLIQLGKVLGVIEEIDGLITTKGAGCWDYIGYKFIRESGEDVEVNGEIVRINQEVSSFEGTPYVHINLRTEVNIRERAEALALENPAIAGALSQIPRFFITDAEGNATLPNEPIRVFC